MRNLNTNVVLEARKFSCTIGEKRILRDVSFQIRRGEYVSIVGPTRRQDDAAEGDGPDHDRRHRGDLEICSIPWEDWKQSDLAKLAALVPRPTAG